ncbi:hypothetical protein NMY22_g12969 [Coprinellus aureogranulatus]|nr:hypothetical protein NMY22_g12969 [Coprinellus aureogranulatus]
MAVRRLIQLEGGRGSRMTDVLSEAEHIARSRIMACDSIKAAWRRLPLEIWDEIFGFHMESARQGRASTRKTCPPGFGAWLRENRWRGGCLESADWDAMCVPNPSLLVSKRWRAVALSTTAAWSGVSLPLTMKSSIVGHIPFIPTHLANHIAPRLQRIANRRLPWSLTISANGRTVVTCPWLAVSCHPRPISSRSLFSGTAEDQYIMRSERTPGIRFNPAFSIILERDYLLLLPHLPSLTKAVILDADLSSPSFPPAIPWPQLTKLFVEHDQFHVPQVRALLSLCASLREFCLRSRSWSGNASNTTTQAAPAILTMHHLKSFTIASGGAVIPPTMFDNLGFPALTNLRIFCHSLGGGSSNRPFPLPFLMLTQLTLVLSHWGGDPDTIRFKLTSILDACPFLDDLVVSSESDFRPVLEPLVFSSGCPRAKNLRSLTLLCEPLAYDFLSYPKVSVGTFPQPLYAMVASRWGASSSLDGSPARLIVRFTADEDGGGRYTQFGVSQSLQMAAKEVLQPFVAIADGLQLSVEVTNQVLHFSPQATAKHWDDGAMEFIDDYWEYTTAMP